MFTQIKNSTRKAYKAVSVLSLSALLLVSFPGISAGMKWGEVLSDAELSAVYAQGLEVSWSIGIMAGVNGSFSLNFNAQGTIAQKDPGSGFLADLDLLGGLFGVKADENTGNKPAGDPPVEIPIMQNDTQIGTVEMDIDAKGGKPGGKTAEIAMGPAGGANMTLFSLNGDGIASSAKVDLMFSKIGTTGGGSGRSTARAIRSAICGGCY